MSEDIFFFDTYAFFELIDGNPKYKRFSDSIPLTCVFNLAELNYWLKKRFDKKTADRYVDKYTQYLIEVDISDIKDAMNLKIKHKKMSIPDTIGYVLAKKYKVKFLTGDNDFRKMPNVEFVK